MINADPKRTPTFTMFGNPDFFFQTTNLSGGVRGLDRLRQPGLRLEPRRRAGGDREHLGRASSAPACSTAASTRSTWTDHTNVRPTMLALLGLKDDYVQDGRVLIEGLTTKATPHALVAHRETVRRLGDVYEQLNAPFGSFALDTLKASTAALASTDEANYASIESKIAGLTAQRDALASKIRGALNAAAFDGTSLNQVQAVLWIAQAGALIVQARLLAATS